ILLTQDSSRLVPGHGVRNFSTPCFLPSSYLLLLNWQILSHLWSHHGTKSITITLCGGCGGLVWRFKTCKCLYNNAVEGVEGYCTKVVQELRERSSGVHPLRDQTTHHRHQKTIPVEVCGALPLDLWRVTKKASQTIISTITTAYSHSFLSVESV